MMTTSTGARDAQKRARTCAGCGEKAAPSALVRLVLGPGGEIAVDAAGGAFGRGAHVHATLACVAKACRGGLSRAFKTAVSARPEALASAIADSYTRRADGLLAAAKRAGAIALGADETRASLSAGAPLVLIAADAGTVIARPEIARAVADGRACAWSSRSALGSVLGRDEVAVCAVTDERIAAAIADAVRTGSALRSAAQTVVSRGPDAAVVTVARATHDATAEDPASAARRERRDVEEDR